MKKKKLTKIIKNIIIKVKKQNYKIYKKYNIVKGVMS